MGEPAALSARRAPENLAGCSLTVPRGCVTSTLLRFLQ